MSDPKRAEEWLIEAALAEDIGDGDRTTAWTVPEGVTGSAEIIVKEDAVLAGSPTAEAVFRRLDSGMTIRWSGSDGDWFGAGATVASLDGDLRAILTGERTALNFLARLCGIATLAARYVEAVAGTGCRIVDTRKTTPGWRALEKAAVAAGGAQNHRAGLYDMVLVKENHIRVAGSPGAALDAVESRAADEGLEVEVEVTDLAELREALDHRPSRILLDNMSIEELSETVRVVRSLSSRPPLLEASGGVTLDSVRAIAETGVDLISVGALTHSARAIDLSLLLDSVEGRKEK